MSDTENLDTFEDTAEGTPSQDPRDAENARLRKELAASQKREADNKTWARTEASKRISSQYGIEMTPDTLKKIGDLTTFEEVLAQVRAPGEKPAEPKPGIPEGYATLEKVQAASQSGSKRYTFAEAKALPWEQRRTAIMQGLVDGVNAP